MSIEAFNYVATAAVGLCITASVWRAVRRRAPHSRGWRAVVSLLLVTPERQYRSSHLRVRASDGWRSDSDDGPESVHHGGCQPALGVAT